MDRFFIDQEISKKSIIDNPEDVKHISKVLRLRVNDSIEIVDVEEKEYLCEILEISKEFIEYKMLKEVSLNRELEINFNVYQGIPKGQKMDLIVQKLTEIGVHTITPVEFKRCISSIKEKKEDKKIARLQRIIYEAAKQSKRNHIPKITNPKSFKEMLNELKNNSINIVFYECELENNIKSYLNSIELKLVKTINIIIGPEGGITPEEIDNLEINGCKILTLGSRILRTETAAVVASAIIAYEIENL